MAHCRNSGINQHWLWGYSPRCDDVFRHLLSRQRQLFHVDARGTYFGQSCWQRAGKMPDPELQQSPDVWLLCRAGRRAEYCAVLCPEIRFHPGADDVCYLYALPGHNNADVGDDG
ncbi:hypothetical protein D3C75_858080 [compost metagenome]